MRVLCLCLFVAMMAPASLGSDNNLIVKFAGPFQKGWYKLPRTLEGLLKDGWRVEEDRTSTEGVSVACRNKDYRVCLIVDKKGSVAGLQIAVAVADLAANGAPVAADRERKTFLGTDVYLATVYFVKEDILMAGGRVIEENTPTAPDGIFLKTQSGLLSVTPKEEGLVGSKFTKQNCFPAMGRHYFYNVSKDMDCNIPPKEFFALYKKQTQDLVGVGYISYGRPTTQENGRSWFEDVPSGVIKMIAPGFPSCVADNVDKYGLHSLHVYLTANPWFLHCLF